MLGSLDWPEDDPASQADAIALLESIDRQYFDDAWARLSQFEYVRDRTITVRDDSGELVGQESQTIRFSGISDRRRVDVLSSDSTGTFERSFWSQFSDREVAGSVVTLPKLVLPDDPLFLSSRGESFFRYRTLPDTMFGPTMVDRIETQVRPETSRQGAQWAKIYVHDGALVGVDLSFVQKSLLYNEVSRFRVLLTRSSGGDWLPGVVRIASTVGLPFARSRSYEMRAEYRDFVRAG